MPFRFGRGGGRGKHRRGGGRGRRGNLQARAFRSAENCICPNCGTVIPHQIGAPCFQIACPNCNSPMTRQFNVPGIYSPTQYATTTQKPVVDQDTCTGCQKCISLCPEQAIEMKDNKAFILSKKCTNCRICIPACPFSAIQ